MRCPGARQDHGREPDAHPGAALLEELHADPADAGMVDVAGFDAAAPAMIADFNRAR